MGVDPFIGVDIRLRKGDLGYTQSGDLDLIGNIDPLENIWQAVCLRLTIKRGTYPFGNKYGSTLGNYVDESLTDELKNRIITEAKQTILEDSRVASVLSLSVTQGDTSLNLTFSITTVTGRTKSGTVTI